MIRDELDLCGYSAIISSEKMGVAEAINLYKNRDASEKVFRIDKSYLEVNIERHWVNLRMIIRKMKIFEILSLLLHKIVKEKFLCE